MFTNFMEKAYTVTTRLSFAFNRTMFAKPALSVGKKHEHMNTSILATCSSIVINVINFQNVP